MAIDRNGFCRGRRRRNRRKRRAGGDTSTCGRPQPDGHGDDEHVGGAVGEHPAGRQSHVSALRVVVQPADRSPHGDDSDDDRARVGEADVRGAQRLSRPLEGAAHGLDGYAFVRRNAVVGPAVDLPEVENALLFGAKCSESRARPRVLVHGQDRLVGFRRRHVVGVLDATLHSPSLATAVIDAEPPGDRRDPRPERSGGRIAVPRGPGSEERLLGQLLGLAGAHQLAPAERDEGTEVGFVQFGEALLTPVAAVLRTPLIHGR